MIRYNIYVKRGILVENESPLGEWVRGEDVRSEIDRHQSDDRALKLQMAATILATRKGAYEGGTSYKAWMAAVSAEVLQMVDTLVAVHDDMQRGIENAEYTDACASVLKHVNGGRTAW